MKTTLALLLLTFSIAKAQEPKSNLSILSPHTKIVYQPASVLYVGIENTLRIESSDKSIKRFLLNIDKAEVRQKGKDFIIKVIMPGNYTLKVYDYSDINNPKLIESREMQAESVPDLFVTFAGKPGGNFIKKEEVVKAEKLEAVCPDCKDKEVQIISCKMSIYGKGIEYSEIEMAGDSIPLAMKLKLREAPTGTKITFEYVKAKYSDAADDNTPRQLPPLSYVIAD